MHPIYLDTMFLCPITKEIMQDPVLLEDGHSYERKNISLWLTQNNTSPITGLKLTSLAFRPNHALRSLIQQSLARKRNISISPISRFPPITIHTTELINENLVHLSLMLPADAKTLPLTLITVLDVSGSMDSPSQEVVSEAAITEGARLSRLDLLKHSMKTIIEMMREEDSLCIVTFSDRSKIALEFTKMNDTGKNNARLIVDKLTAGGSTNLWSGLSQGIDLANMAAIRETNIAVVLQTDGEPSVQYNPPNGSIAGALSTKLLRKTPNVFSIHSCGYGYGTALDSSLLRNIASQGKGGYHYVPDGSMVGTVFVHLLVNLQTVAINDLSIEFKKFNNPNGYDPLQVGFMRPGQSRDFIVDLSGVETIVPRIQGEIVNYHEVKNPNTVSSRSFEYNRSWFLKRLGEAILKAETNRNDEALAIIMQLDSELSKIKDDKRIQSLRSDLLSTDKNQGQIGKAIQHWKKWGCHYLPSVWFAHSRQEKSNFKDASMQLYSTPLLDSLIAQGEDIFVSLPPPKPSIHVYGATNLSATPINMGNMMNQYSGCFTGDCKVETKFFGKRRIDSLVAGTQLKSGAIIKCIVKYKVNEKEITRIGNLGITNWHPIRKQQTSTWEFPCNVTTGTISIENCQTVFNFVLNEHHYIEIDDYECVTLGHSFQGPVVSHPYFGTNKCIEDLEKMNGFQQGLVEYEHAEVKMSNGLVSGIAEGKLSNL